jgi:gamma-glutamylaminecyclotransferase
VALLFVYGTLLGGERNHAVLSDARFVGAARTRADMTLLDLGPYPALARGGSTAVSGEVWDVATFDPIDAFEGPNYAREIVTLDDGTTAQAYVLKKPAADLLATRPSRSGARPITSGDWRAHVASRLR